MMTAEEEADLLGLSEELSRAFHSPWEPRCISAAFARAAVCTFTLTMQAWCDLDHDRSPLLQDSVVMTREQFGQALRAFGHVFPEDLTASEADVLTDDMRAAVLSGFSTMLKMCPPDGKAAEADADGFGAWLPLISCLVVQCHYTMVDALACPVSQAFALLAGMRRNQGWSVAGEAYALRDIKTEAAA